MLFDLEMIEQFYSELPAKVAAARKMLGRPMTLSEKILYAHLSPEAEVRKYTRGADYALLRPTAWLCRTPPHKWLCCSL